MLNIVVDMLMETIMAEAEAEKLHEEVITNKAAVAARRATAAKKAAKVATEAAKFEGKKAWKQPNKQEYLFEKAANATVGNYMFIGHMAHDSFTVISTSKKDNCHGSMATDIADYFAAEHRLDIIESKVLREYEEYGDLVYDYKRYKSQEDWGTYDDWDELQEDMDEVVDKIYAIGKKYFDKLIPEYLDLCEYLGYIPNYDVVSAEQWRYF